MRKLTIALRNKIGQIAIILVCLIVEAYCLLMLPQYTSRIIDVGIKNTDFNVIYNTGSMMILMVLISAIAQIICSYYSAKVSSGYARDLREMVFEKILKFSNHEINSFTKASLITRTTNDIGQIQNISLIALTTIVFAPILGIGSTIKAFSLKTDLSWIILITFLVVIIILIFISLKIIPKFQTFQEYMDDINKASREILIGIPVIKAFVRQDFEEKKFEKINMKLYKLTMTIYRNLLPLQPLLIFALDLMVVGIIYYGSYEVANGIILTGNLIAFVQYATQIVIAFTMVGSFMVSLPRVAISGRRVNEILETEITLTDGEIDKISEKPTIEFKNVTYRYPQSENESLKNINLKLEPGKTVGIIGGTGSGKSTILNLIPRLQDPTSGEILIDGKNIKEYKLEALRERISLTPQKALLMHGSVKSNMKMAKSDATDSEIETALQKAHVNFIESLDDPVAQGGSNFSGGQKQRLVIARSLIKYHDFYLFDDSFSALDMNTEKIVKDNLKDLKDSSVLIVSQRISTIIDADEIIVMEKGEIVDRGNHDSLAQSCEIYKEILSSQSDIMGGAL